MSVMKIDLHINHEDVPTERYSEFGIRADLQMSWDK